MSIFTPAAWNLIVIMALGSFVCWLIIFCLEILIGLFNFSDIFDR